MGVFYDRFRNKELDWWQRVTPDEASVALGELNTNDDEWSKDIAAGTTESYLILQALIGRSLHDEPHERLAYESTGAEFVVDRVPQTEDEIADFIRKRSESIEDMLAREDAATLTVGEGALQRSVTHNLGSMPSPDLELAAIAYREREAGEAAAKPSAPGAAALLGSEGAE